MASQEETSPEFILQISQRIKQLRKEKGYTSYEKFAHASDISRMQYWRYEKGEDMRISSLKKVTDAFGMTLEEFFKEGFD